MKLFVRNRPPSQPGLLLLAFLLTAPFNPAIALEYKTELTPMADGILEEAARVSSVLIELEEKPPDDLYGLYRRAQEDKPRLEKALRSSGYYNGEVSIRIAGRSVDDPAATDIEPQGKATIPVTIEIRPGKLYHLRDISVTGAEKLPDKLKPELAAGAPARAADIVAEQDRLLNAVLAQGYPFAAAKLEPALVDHKDLTVSVHYSIDPGPPAKIGDIRVKGLDRVDSGFVDGRLAEFTGRP